MVRKKCPFCGATVFLDRKKLTVHHGLPLCPEFEIRCRDADSRLVTILNVPDEDKPS